MFNLLGTHEGGGILQLRIWPYEKKLEIWIFWGGILKLKSHKVPKSA